MNPEQDKYESIETGSRMTSVDTSLFPVNSKSNLRVGFLNNTLTIFYTGNNGKICGSWLDWSVTNGHWNNFCANNTLPCKADSNLEFGTISTGNGVFYISDKNKICCALYKGGTTWENFVLNEKAIAPKLPNQYNYGTQLAFWILDGQPTIFYLGSNSLINTLSFDGKNWNQGSLNAPVKCSHYPSLCLGTYNGLTSVFFIGDDNKIYLGQHSGSAWTFKVAFKSPWNYPNSFLSLSPLVFSNGSYPQNLFFIDRDNYLCGIKLATGETARIMNITTRTNSNIIYRYAVMPKSRLNLLWCVSTASKIIGLTVVDGHDATWRDYGVTIPETMLVREQSPFEFFIIVPPPTDGGFSITTRQLFFINSLNEIWCVKC